MKTGGYISTEFTVWCGEEDCCEWCQESAKNKADFIKQMQDAGWKQISKRWTCPDCCKKREAAQ